MKPILLATLIQLPILGLAQNNISGIWRLTEENYIDGPQYANAIPKLLKIKVDDNNIYIERKTTSKGRDTIIIELLQRGANQNTVNGENKYEHIYFSQFDDGKGWTKEKRTFNTADTTTAISVDNERYELSDNGKHLAFIREYQGKNDKPTNQSFKSIGQYTKTSEEEISALDAKGRGINFVEGLTWNEVLLKAKAENKFIFVDCYATWCAPCKMMDREVFDLNRVGHMMNEQFIAVKIQMDSTAKDPIAIRKWYATAKGVAESYQISAFPTYLFLSADGEIVHKAIGQQKPDEFLATASEATNPNNQIYTLVRKAKNSALPIDEYPSLANRVRIALDDKKLELELVKIYKESYLDALSEQSLLTKENLDFIERYPTLVQSKDLIFELCYEKPSTVNAVKHSESYDFSNYIVKGVIQKEEIQPLIKLAEDRANEPLWSKMENTIKKKYGADKAQLYVLESKVTWYNKQKKWDSVLKYIPVLYGYYGLDKLGPWQLNSAAYKVFKHSFDTLLMKKALVWIDKAIEKAPRSDSGMIGMFMDTKASVLYKIGRIKEAIQLEKQIIEEFPSSRPAYQPTVELMEKGVKIWEMSVSQ